MKRFCNNEIFNWLFIFSCIPYFISPYNIAHAVFDYLYNKYCLLEKKEELKKENNSEQYHQEIDRGYKAYRKANHCYILKNIFCQLNFSPPEVRC